MSERIVGRRYALALKKSVSLQELETFEKLLSEIVACYSNKQFVDVVKSPLIGSMDKANLVLELIKEKPAKLANLIKLLAHKDRLMTIPSLIEEIRLEIAKERRSYVGEVMARSKIDKKQIDELSSALTKKLGVNVELKESKVAYDGIKVTIDDLGIEIDFSKNQVKSQILGHILRGF